MANSYAQFWEAYHGEDVTVTLTGEDDTDPSAYSLLVTVNPGPGVTGTSPSWSTTSVTVAGDGPYTLSFTIPRATSGTTLTADVYQVDAWRTDSGSSVLLARGTLYLHDPVRAPA